MDCSRWTRDEFLNSVCSIQLTLHATVLLHSSTPTEELCGEMEFWASTSFLKIWFVTGHIAEPSHNHLLLKKVKNTHRRMDLVNWDPCHIMPHPCSYFPCLLQMISLIVLIVVSSQMETPQAKTVRPLLFQLGSRACVTQSKEVGCIKSTCRP